MRPTLTDVAKLAGVAKSTVSLTLRDHPKSQRFGSDTRERILAAAEQLDYRPHFFASQLRREHRQMVMVYVMSFEDLYCATIAGSFERRAAQRGYKTLVSAVDGRSEPEVLDRDVIGRHGVSAVALLGGASEMLADRSIAALAEEGVRIVLVGRHAEHEAICHVAVDQAAGARQAAKYLYDQGGTDVWIICSADPDKTRTDRVWAFGEYARQAGRPDPVEIRLPGGETPFDFAQQAYEAVRRRLAESGPPEAIFAVMDMFCYGAMRALFEAGHRVGQDVGVVGEDDIWPSQFTSPSLTTVRQPMAEMGTAAADMLIDALVDQTHTGRTVTVSPELVVRRSGTYVKRPARPAGQ